MKLATLTAALGLHICHTSCYKNDMNGDFVKGISTDYILDDPLAVYRNDDHSAWTPSISAGGRVIDLINGEFFDEHLRDTPDHMRPPAIVAIYDSFNKECFNKYKSLNFESTVLHEFPSRAFLFAAKYDSGAASRRTWYKFIPERDLLTRFGLSSNNNEDNNNNNNNHGCPAIVFVPPHCNGFTKWCINKVDNETGVEYLGCDEYEDQCKNEYKIWNFDNENGVYSSWIEWIENFLDSSPAPSLGGPKLDGPHKKEFRNMKEQEDWLLSRDESTQRENYRNNWVSSALPGFTELGYKAVKMSDEHIQELREFYEKWRHKRRPENWRSKTQTAVNGHVVEPSMVSLDEDMQFRGMYFLVFILFLFLSFSFFSITSCHSFFSKTRVISLLVKCFSFCLFVCLAGCILSFFCCFPFYLFFSWSFFEDILAIIRRFRQLYHHPKRLINTFFPFFRFGIYLYLFIFLCFSFSIDMIANKYIKPALEEWVGIPLQLTSHYGIREYYDGSWLKNHIDRIDVLIISATQSIGHLICNISQETGYCDDDDNDNDNDNDNDLNSPIDWESGWPDDVSWPLEGVDWKGNNIRYSHPPGTMILYESAKFIHGRPYPLPQHPNHPYSKYVHLGSFCHFTPADGSWKERGHPQNARENLNRHIKRQGRSFKAPSNYQPSKAFLRQQEGDSVPSPVKHDL